MVDFRPFRALRYNPEVAGDAARLIAPPYDVVSPEEQSRLHGLSPHNVSRVDYGEALPGDSPGHNRYTRARDEIRRWLAGGVLTKDDDPRFYAYDQEFTLRGQRLTRRAIFGRLRLEEWEKGLVLPHEQTRPAAKADRLDLLRATRVHLSPIMAMYRSPASRPLTGDAELGPAVLDAVLPGERHTLRPLRGEAKAYVQRALAQERLYVADGHHRYETALSYRNERRDKVATWTGQEPENFVLAAVVHAGDPGLVVLPTHRLVRLTVRPPDLASLLKPSFVLTEAGSASSDEDVDRLPGMMAEAGLGGPAFGAIGVDPGRLHLVTVRDRAAVDRRIPAGHASAWRQLDVNVLHYALLAGLGKIAPDQIDFTEDARHAAAEVLSGRWNVAFLLNATPIDHVIACAEAGERMPEKSTYFYPKLATGMVMYPLE